MIKRNLLKLLIQWKNAKRRKPLILKGARQVGKTYLLKMFGQQEYQETVYINFEENKQVRHLFASNLTPKEIIKNLSLLLSQKISSKNTLLIFDEIQECPNALNSLKYFNEEANEYHIIAAGSLLGVKLSANEKGFPVGKVNFLELFPLSFTEFLSALGQDQLFDFLKQIRIESKIQPSIHQMLLQRLQEFFIVGGMPEVVATYVENADFNEVRTIQQEILEAYAFDFSKHAPPLQVAKIMQVWQSIPSQLAKENKKFIFSTLGDSARGREFDTAIQWLQNAGLIDKSFLLSTPKIPPLSYATQNIFKVFLLDVGLLSAMSKLPPRIILEDNKLFSEFKGALTENFVANELIKQFSHPLFYWTSSGTAEVDFLFCHEGLIYPLEVKAGENVRSKSLQVYQQKYTPRMAFRTSLLNLMQQETVTNIPLYLVGQLIQAV
jgi:predicted AAA+ superfamily ATPase